jgi:hypothetical protein
MCVESGEAHDRLPSTFRIGADQASTARSGNQHPEVEFGGDLSLLALIQGKVEVEEGIRVIRPVFKVHQHQRGGDAEVARCLRRHRGSVRPGQPQNRTEL